MEHRRKNSFKGTSEVLRAKTCRSATFFHHKSHTEWPFLKAGFCSMSLANNSESNANCLVQLHYNILLRQFDNVPCLWLLCYRLCMYIPEVLISP